MEKVIRWVGVVIFISLLLPLAIGIGGAFYFSTSADSLKMRLMSASMNDEAVSLTVLESIRLTLSRLLPIPLVILGFVGEWHWEKMIMTLM